jgi:hypothetical protein
MDEELEALRRIHAQHPTLGPINGIARAVVELELIGLVIAILLGLILWKLW